MAPYPISGNFFANPIQGQKAYSNANAKKDEITPAFDEGERFCNFTNKFIEVEKMIHKSTLVAAGFRGGETLNFRIFTSQIAWAAGLPVLSLFGLVGISFLQHFKKDNEIVNKFEITAVTKFLDVNFIIGRENVKSHFS